MEKNNIKNPEQYFLFQSALYGFDFYLNGSFIPRYVLYWRNLSSEKLILGNTKYKVVPRG